jgi:hypothetical protein
MTRLPAAVGVNGLALLLLAGCSGKQAGQLNSEEQALVNLGLAYREASAALKRGPTSVAELKPYLEKYGNPDDLLVSANDGQPYEIVWGVIPSRPARGFQTQRLLIYEKVGKHGKRYALDCMLKIHHLSDSEFASMTGSQ